MANIGKSYGSEFHLLRYLGYHRQELNRAVEKETGGQVTEWLDFAFGGKRKLDREWQGLDFVESPTEAKAVWREFWPQTGNVPNWDAVGRLESNSVLEYLLVEAKAHVEELRSSCLAKGPNNENCSDIERAPKATKKGGLEKIKVALKTTINAYHFKATVEDWLAPYYQCANRLAHLHFLSEHGIPARLVFIYFLGDDWGDRKLNGKPPVCPRAADEWDAPLKLMYEHLGLRGQSELERRVHKLFLHV